ncbi:MAG TPA: PAS domain-containing sensor histidine kinase [Clostridia bacterium]
MDVKYYNELNSKPYIFVEGDEVEEAGELFFQLVGYDKSDIIGRESNFVLNNLLKLCTDTNELRQSTKSFFIFTKDLKPIEVGIEVINIPLVNGSLIIFQEKNYTEFEEKNTYLTQLFNSEISGIAVYSVPDMILLKANKKYLDFLQPPYNEKYNSIGRRIYEIIPGWKGSPVEQYWKEAINTGKVVQVKEYEHTGYDKGITYWESIITPLYEDGKIKYAVSNTYEVTERVLNRKKVEAQEKEIREQKEKMHVIVEKMKEAICIFDKYGNYIIVNEAGREYLEENIEKVGQSLGKIDYYELDGRKIGFEDTPAYHTMNGRTVEEKVLLMKSLNRETYVSICSSPIFDENGNFIYGVVTIRNVTNKILLEKKIKEQQELIIKAERAEKQILENSMRMKDEFLATITHEFKTPLTVINAALQTIEGLYGKQVPDNIKKHLQRIRTNSFRQLRLVNNLLDITRYNAGRFKMNKNNMDIVFLTNVIVKSVDAYARQKGVTLKFSTDIKCKEIAVDEEKYERILLNLLSNAIKFTPQGKFIHVDVSCKNRKVTISIKDEGIGIPKSKLKLIFKRFGQVDSSLSRQAEGTGIGLSLVKTLVTAMGGTIVVDSVVGNGSTFTVTLPVSKVRCKRTEINMLASPDSRVMQVAAIEFSDIYLE